MDRHARIGRLRKMIRLWDDQFRISWIPCRFGLDSLVGVIPGIGDIVGMLFSLYVLYEAILLKIPFLLLVRMVWNIAVDFLVGLIPVLGDVFDVVWKANRKNVRLIEKYFRSHPTA